MNTDIAYSRADAETERTVDVPEQGWFIVQDGVDQEVKDARTDYAVCECPDPNGTHPVTKHVRYVSPIKPSSAVMKRYPGCHLVEREVAWTGWTSA